MLGKVRSEDIATVMKEATGGRAPFISRTYARLKNENPYFVHVIDGIAEIASREAIQTQMTPSDLAELVREVGAYAYRLLELGSSGKGPALGSLEDVLMRDPDAQCIDGATSRILENLLARERGRGSSQDQSEA